MRHAMLWRSGLTFCAICFRCLSQELLVDQATGILGQWATTVTDITRGSILQSFTPSLDAIGFVQLGTLDGLRREYPQSLLVHLRETSPTGPIIASTDPVVLFGTAQVATFFFQDNVPISPGQLYFLEPVLLSVASLFSVGVIDFSTYSKGQLWSDGFPSDISDIWFREGIVIPEPSVSALLIIGSGAILGLRRWRRPSSHPGTPDR